MKRFISGAAVFLLLSNMLLSPAAAKERVNYTFTWDDVLTISGKSQNAGENISVSVFSGAGEKSGELIFVDQVKSDSDGRFGVSAKIENQRDIKISLNSEHGKEPVKNFAVNTGKTIYVSKENFEDADGSVQRPFCSISDAINAAGENGKIKIIGKIDVDEDINHNFEKITVSGGEIVLNSSLWDGNIRFSNTKVTISEQFTFKGITEFSETEINNSKKVNAEYLYTNTAAANEVEATAVIVGDGMNINTEKIKAEYIVFCGKGGGIEIKNGNLMPKPNNGRAYSIDGEAYTTKENILSKGTHKVVFDYDFMLSGVDVSKTGDGLYNMRVTGSAKDLLKKHSTLQLVAGVYDDQTLIAAKSLPVQTGANVNETFEFENIAAEEVDVKIFLWDSFMRIVPLTSVFIADSNTKINQESDVFYVSPDGKENATGGFFDPLSVNAAINAAKNKDTLQKIILRGGEYKFNSSIVFDENCKNIVVMPYDEEEVLFSDSDVIPYDMFKAADNTVKRRIIDESARDKILTVNLKSAGISNLGLIRAYELQNFSGRLSPMLTIDNNLMTLARYPNKTADGKSKFLTIQEGSDEKPLNQGSKTQKFSFFVDEEAEQHFSNWAQNYDLWLCGYLRHMWADGIYKGTIKQTQNGAYYFESNNPWKLSGPAAGGKVYFQNVLEELDSPGEWYLERPSGNLYIYPPEGFNENSEIRFSTNNRYSVQINGGKNITIKKLNLKSISLKINNAEDVTVDGCEISGGGNIDISNSVRCTVKNNYMYNLLSGGISILSGGDPETLTYSNNRIENNIIRNFAQETKCYVPAINLGGVGSVVSNNEIYNAPHTAILIGGQMNTIELNKIHDVCLEVADSGAIYGHGNFVACGNVIRYNIFRNIDRKSSGDTSIYPNHAVYLDMLLSNVSVYGNIFQQCESAALFNGGRSNEFYNNVIADCDISLTISNIGQWDNYPQEVEKMVDSFEQTVPYYKNDIWKAKFPSLYNLRQDDPTVPKYCKVYNNVIYNSEFPDVAQIAEKFGVLRDNYVFNNSNVFSDYENDVLSIKNEGMVFEKIHDFEQIPYYFIGLRH